MRWQRAMHAWRGGMAAKIKPSQQNKWREKYASSVINQ